MSLSKEELNKSLSELDKLLKDVEQSIKPIVTRPLTDTTKDMEPLDNAQFQLDLAYTMNTLFYLYMKLQNANLVGHPVVKDMERLKEYMGKLEDARQNGDVNRLRLDKSAAKRFVTHALKSSGAEFNNKSEEVIMDETIQSEVLSDSESETKMEE